MIELVSEDSLLIRFGDHIDPALPQRIADCCRRIEALNDGWLTDLVPSYTTLLVSYDPIAADSRTVRKRLQQALDHTDHEPACTSGRVHRLPVWYSPVAGADLQYVAEQSVMSVDDVIRIHSSTAYRVYAVGFAPGFAFMGQVDPRIAIPRKDTPRARVPAGSVAVANRQTAIYPLESPGGWQLIGRSPATLFDLKSLSLLRTGDEVRFHPISEEEYLRLSGDRI